VRARVFAFACLIGCGGGEGSPDAQIDAPGPVEVVVTVDDHPAALLVGYQDGDGTWTMPARTGDAYAFTVTTDRWGFALACASATDYYVNVYQALVADQTTLTTRPSGACRDPANVRTGTIAAAPSAGASALGLATSSFAMDGAYTFNPRVGVADWLIVARTPQPDGYTVGALKIVRDVDVAAGATMQNEDLSAGTLAPAANAAVLTGVVAGETAAVTTAYFLRDSAGVGASQDTTDPYAIQPLESAYMMAGDLTRIEGAASTASTLRRVFTYHDSAQDSTLELPPVLGGVNVGNATAIDDPYIRLVATWPAIADSDTYVIQYNQGVVHWTVFLSAGLGTTYTLPRLDAVPGWTPGFGMVGAMAIGWTVDARDSSVGFDLHHLEAVAGERWTVTNRTGTFTPP
jgi:hypothetical protein